MCSKDDPIQKISDDPADGIQKNIIYIEAPHTAYQLYTFYAEAEKEGEKRNPEESP